MISGFAVNIGPTPRSANFVAPKIDGSPLETYSIGLAEFLLPDSLRRIRFFEETFLLSDINME